MLEYIALHDLEKAFPKVKYMVQVNLWKLTTEMVDYKQKFFFITIYLSRWRRIYNYNLLSFLCCAINRNYKFDENQENQLDVYKNLNCLIILL